MSPAARTKFKRFFYMYRQRHRFLYRLKWVQCSPLVAFTHNVKNIKGAADKMVTFKVRLHVPSMCPCPSKLPSKFIIVPMVMDHLMNRLRFGSYSVHQFKFDDDCYGDGTCKRTFTVRVSEVYSAIHKAAGRAIPDFAWYNSCGTEKIP